jgi:hypothetical protein
MLLIAEDETTRARGSLILRNPSGPITRLVADSTSWGVCHPISRAG